MTTATSIEDPARDHRGSPVPTRALIAARLLELRRRRGLMLTLVLVTVGIPAGFLGARLILHAVSPHTYGPAGGYDVFAALTGGVLYTFGFIVAAALGCIAGSADLSEGMFRHLVTTGRSRVALYLARIPAGLAVVGPLVAIGFAIVCTVCSFAAPNSQQLDGLRVPAGLSEPALETWAADHAQVVMCALPDAASAPTGCAGVAGGPSSFKVAPPPATVRKDTPAQLRAAARQVARENYSAYASHFTAPSTSLMVRTGLWIELEVLVGFVVGLGLGSLLGQRTIAVVIMIVLQVVITPIVLRVKVPHLDNVERAVVGVATAHLEPGQLPLTFGGGGGDYRLGESTLTAALVVIAWVIGWTALGAWRMATRDA